MRRLTGLLAFIAACGVIFAGCDGFLSIENPNDATNEQLQQVPQSLIPAGAAGLAVNKTVENWGTACFAQTFAGTNTGGLFLNTCQYTIGGLTQSNTFLNNYVTAAGNFNQVVQIAQDADPASVSYSPANVEAQASILLQTTYFYITRFFGEVPYSQANQPDAFPQPDVDPQEEILRGVIAELDTAVANLDPSQPGISGDFFYDGDIEKWIRFANTTKLQAYFLLLSGEGTQTGAGVDGALPNGNDLQTEIENLITQDRLIRSNDSNFQFPYQNQDTQENPLWKTNTLLGVQENIIVYCGEELVEQMQAENDPREQDPRLRLYCEEDDFPNSTFSGIPAGTPGTGNSTAPDFVAESRVSDVIVRPEAPEEFATAAENLLLEAEWELRTNDQSAARTKLERAIRENIELLNGYPNVGDDQISPQETNDFLNSLPSANNLTLQDIHRQQYVTLFERQLDVWTHWRRTKFPDLEPAASAATDGNVIPRRYDVPDDETSANPNVESRDIETPMWFEGPSAQ
jgi:hypothetical protein